MAFIAEFQGIFTKAPGASTGSVFPGGVRTRRSLGEELPRRRREGVVVEHGRVLDRGLEMVDQYMDLLFHLEDLLGERVDLVTIRGLRKELRTNIEREAVRVA